DPRSKEDPNPKHQNRGASVQGTGEISSGTPFCRINAAFHLATERRPVLRDGSEEFFVRPQTHHFVTWNLMSHWSMEFEPFFGTSLHRIEAGEARSVDAEEFCGTVLIG